jgi:toxin HigB-1
VLQASLLVYGLAAPATGPPRTSSTGRDRRAARRCLPSDRRQVAQRRLDRVNRAREPRDLSDPPGNRLEALRGDCAGFFSIRVNDQYRIVFRFESGDDRQVQIVDH